MPWFRQIRINRPVIDIHPNPAHAIAQEKRHPNAQGQNAVQNGNIVQIPSPHRPDRPEKHDPQKKENDVTKTPQKDVYNLIGKRVTSIDSIVSNKTCRVIFLFNYYDCGSCIDLGFSITKKIDSLYRNNKVAIISTMGSPSSFQKRNKYYEYIYLDSKDLIRKELKYVPTPIVFLLDSSNCIKDYILPNSSNSKEIGSFIKSVCISVKE